jgi:hypothetical protein
LQLCLKSVDAHAGLLRADVLNVEAVDSGELCQALPPASIIASTSRAFTAAFCSE